MGKEDERVNSVAEKGRSMEEGVLSRPSPQEVQFLLMLPQHQSNQLLPYMCSFDYHRPYRSDHQTKRNDAYK